MFYALKRESFMFVRVHKEIFLIGRVLDIPFKHCMYTDFVVYHSFHLIKTSQAVSGSRNIVPLLFLVL